MVKMDYAKWIEKLNEIRFRFSTINNNNKQYINKFIHSKKIDSDMNNNKTLDVVVFYESVDDTIKIYHNTNIFNTFLIKTDANTIVNNVFQIKKSDKIINIPKIEIYDIQCKILNVEKNDIIIMTDNSFRQVI